MEGAATTVYAQGGRGNARLVAWEGERTVTFTMEDALISAEGFMILSGAGLVAATEDKTIKQHMTETIDKSDVTVEGTEEAAADAVYKIKLSKKPYLPKDAGEDFAYVMFCKDGEIISEPFIPVHEEVNETDGAFIITVKAHDNYNTPEDEADTYNLATFFSKNKFDSVIVDYYTERKSNAQQIEITADKFGGNYYLEASTLFRDQNGVDMPAEFIIPNCKIQSNFTFTMASSGDPSTFTFTMDAFPDYTRFDHSKKVLAAIQVIEEAGSQDLYRTQTVHLAADDAKFS